MMIFVRRVAALVLATVFIPVLTVSLVLVRLNDTLMEPRFYPDLMKSVGMYRFVMVDVLTSALEDARQIDSEQLGVGSRQNPLVTSGLTTRQIVEAVHLALSPQDLERMMAPAVLEIAEFVMGDRDSFVVKFDAGKHVGGAVDEVHKLMRESDAYDRFIEYELEPRVRGGAEEVLSAKDVADWMLYLFESAEDAEDRVVRVVMRMLTAEWLAVQVEQALDELTAYLVGESDSFEIRVELTDAQVTTAFEETESILREADAYDLVFLGVVEPVLEDELGSEIRLPYGVSVTREEVTGALRQAAPPSWAQRQAENLIDNVVPYVLGRSEGFSIQIDLSRNKQVASEALTDVVIARVDDALTGLPACATRSEASAARRRLESGLPACIPQGVSTSDVLERAAPAIDESIRTFVLASIPDTVTFTELDFRSTLEQSVEPKTPEHLDTLRTVFREGWSYSQDDLRAELSERSGALQALDGTRSFFRDGYSYSYRDRSDRRSNDPVGIALNIARAGLELVSRYEWWAYLLTPALLIAIGLLGGTSWRGRVLWASSTLLVSAGLVFVLSSYVQYAQDALLDVVYELAQLQWSGALFGDTQRLVGVKLVEVVERVIDEFVGGIRLYSLVLVVAATVVLVTAVCWRWVVEVAGRVQRRRNLSPGSGVR